MYGDYDLISSSASFGATIAQVSATTSTAYNLTIIGQSVTSGTGGSLYLDGGTGSSGSGAVIIGSASQLLEIGSPTSPATLYAATINVGQSTAGLNLGKSASVYAVPQGITLAGGGQYKMVFLF